MTASTPTQLPTQLPAPNDPEALYVVDLMGFVFRAYHALPPMSSPSGEPTHAIFGATRMLLSLIEELKPYRLAIALDAPGPSFRKDIYDQYKANRPPAPEDLRPQIERVSSLLDAYDIPVLSEDKFEADDLIATLAKKASAEGLKVVIVSVDKDLLQLVDDRVCMYDSARQKVYGPAEAEEKMGVPPNKIRDFLSLTGDSSDNIPGVRGVGPKTAQKLLAEHDSLEAIYEALPSMTKKALKKKLESNKDEAFLSQKLVTLKEDAPVDMDLDRLRYGGADRAALAKLFQELGFHALLRDLHDEAEPPDEEAAAEEPTGPVKAELIGDIEALKKWIEGAREAGVVALDTVTEQEDPIAADWLGLALSCSKEAGAYLPIGHLYLGAPSQPREAEVVEALRPLLEDPDFSVVVADAKREMMLWRQKGVELRGVSLDVGLASYVLSPARHAHTLPDIARAERLKPLPTYKELRGSGRKKVALSDVPIEQVLEVAAEQAAFLMWVGPTLEKNLEEEGLRELLDDLELPLSRVLAGMELAGVSVDVPRLQKQSASAEERMKELEKKAYELAGHPFKIRSPRELETILFDELKLPVIKRTKTARSTAHDVLEELMKEHELPEVIVSYRQLSKLRSTYLEALPKAIHAKTGRIHTRFNQRVAATGRLSSSDPNLQNIPIRTEEGRAIREAFVPKEGTRLLSADYSQIELRVLAHLSGDPSLSEAFQTDTDVHVRTACTLFEVEPEAVSRTQRDQAKTVNYAVIYGQSHFALAKNLGIERSEAKRYIEAFFKGFEGVASYLDGLVEEAQRRGVVHTMLGRLRPVPDIRSKNFRLRSAAERVVRNTPIQGSAADILKVAMLKVDEALREEKLGSQMLLTVHDELLFEVPLAEEARMRELVREQMEGAVELDVPLKVELGVGETWREAH